MALMHFQHKTIGKKTHAARAATSALSYITRFEDAESTAGRQAQGNGAKGAATEAVGYNARESAASVTIAGRMPEDRNGAARWIEGRAREDRADARICDTFIVGLPRELTREQNTELLRDWCETATKGKAAYFAAIHDKGKDAANPHAHIIIRDRDYSLEDVTEKQRPRVIGTSTSKKEVEQALEKGWRVPPRATTYDLRETWANVTNKHLELAGRSERVDARSYKAQGIDKPAGIHIGPKGRRAQERGHQPESRPRERGRRTIPYDVIDVSPTRSAENHVRKLGHLLNLADVVSRDLTSQPLRASETRDDVLRSPRDLLQVPAGGDAKSSLSEDHKAERREQYVEQSLDRLALRSLHRAEASALKTMTAGLFGEAREAAFAAIGAEFGAKWDHVWKLATKAEIDAASAALKQEQRAAYAVKSAALMAEARIVKDRTTRDLQSRQKLERSNLAANHKEERHALSGDQAAERKPMLEQKQAVRDHTKAASGQAMHSGSQGMTAVQGRAMRQIRMRSLSVMARAQTAPTPLHPLERGKRQALRWQLEAQTRAHREADRHSETRRTAKAQPVAAREVTGEQSDNARERYMRMIEQSERKPATSDEREKSGNITRNKGGNSTER